MHETANTDLLEKVYDVTPTMVKIQSCCTTRVTLILEAEEAVKETVTCFGRIEKRLPYGEMGDGRSDDLMRLLHGVHLQLV